MVLLKRAIERKKSIYDFLTFDPQFFFQNIVWHILIERLNELCKFNNVFQFKLKEFMRYVSSSFILKNICTPF